MRQHTEYVEQDSYEGIFGKGILLMLSLTYLFYLFMGNHNVSWQGVGQYKVWLVAGIFLFYIWHFKLVKEANEHRITDGYYVILTYSLINSLFSMGFSAQYVIAFGMYQALLINGYTGSVYYRGLTILKEQIAQGKLQAYAKQILDLKENKIQENKQEN